MERVIFTKEMKKTHTILIPTMLPVHFKMIEQILRQHGYKAVLLENAGQDVVSEGLKNVHNDTCYPALLVIGQLIDALESGKYDLDKVALLITQTGGGCRASNYIHLLRKALAKSGYGNIPVISFSFAGMESNPGFRLTLPLTLQMLNAVFLGDLLMLLQNQCRSYEKVPGETLRKVHEWTDRLVQILGKSRLITGRKLREICRSMLDDFAAVERSREEKIKVGVVGEIYVKYSPLGNNNLEAFLLEEGTEVVVPGLLGFLMYCVYNGIEDQVLYGGKVFRSSVNRIAFRFLSGREKQLLALIREHGVFRAPMPFTEKVKLVDGYISRGVKMGEGWLLTAEILSLIEEGIGNIVCTQPFGCLPNHIAGKGMIRTIKEKHPQANIVAIDYDPGASTVNQQNRIKLMLANAQAFERRK